MLPNLEFEPRFGMRAGAEDTERWCVGQGRASGSFVMVVERQWVDLDSNELSDCASPFTRMIVQLRNGRTALAFGNGVYRDVDRIYE